MSPPSNSPRFERVDWETVERSRGPVTAERVTLLVALLAVCALFVYDSVYARLYLIGTWRAAPVDWAFLLAAAVALAYGVVPAIRHRRRLGAFLSRLRNYPLALAGGAYLAAVLVVGLLGPLVVSDPGLRFQHAFHSPVGFSSALVPTDCLGTVEGEAFERRCTGTWSYPLGTNERGHGLGFLLVAGSRVTLYVVAIAAVFIVPLAAGVGVIAGFRGGLVDDLLMSYVDLQLSIPAIVLYFVGYAYFNPSLLLLLVAFGLLSWGGIARLVRSETLQRRENGHVLVARSLGASSSYLTRRHILPNVTNTLVPAVFQLLAIFVLVEAGIAFLGFHQLELYSWGSTISESVNAAVPGQLQNRADVPAYRIWWVSLLPTLALSLTVLSFKLLGDGVRDALDPRR